MNPPRGVAWPLRADGRSGRDWVLLSEGEPVGLMRAATEATGCTNCRCRSRRAPRPTWLALDQAAQAVKSAGLTPAAVIDALETTRYRLLRAAGFYTVAAYLVFYDAEAGRPSVGRMSLEELQALLGSGEPFRLVDVMGEEHWKAGHIPGAEWIDFKGLAREARERFRSDETLVLYCNGFT